MKTLIRILATLTILLSPCAGAIEPVTSDDWGLKIVTLEVGQADAALILSRDGAVIVVDLGAKAEHGTRIAEYLQAACSCESPQIDLLIATHYDGDHIGGAAGLLNSGVTILQAYDQGPSGKRAALNPRTLYSKYVKLVGDPDGDSVMGPSEENFVRKTARPFDPRRGGLIFGSTEPNLELFILAAAGDTVGASADIQDLDPSGFNQDSDENPGSVITLVRYGDFEYLTTGDATSDDWKKEPDTEESIIHANAIPGGPDIDVLKVAHHGSDTSSGKIFVSSVHPELAIISADGPSTKHGLPKLTSIKALEEQNARVLLTGSAKDAEGQYFQSKHPYDDCYEPMRLIDGCGEIEILVSSDGSRYTVRSSKRPDLIQTYSAVDEDNAEGDHE